MIDPLIEYNRTGSQEAFAALVNAHVDAVYSQSLRQVRDPGGAQEITQMVFITLAQNAHKLAARAVVSSWLFNTTRYCCKNYQRSVARRTAAERKAALMRNETVPFNLPDDGSASTTDAMLNDALANLNERDRGALLLRFFEGRSLREVGEAMGVSEDAAKQRVSRAVDRLRDYFGRRGVTIQSAGVVSVLTSAVKPAAPHVAEMAAKAAVGKHMATAIAKTAWTAPKIAAAALFTAGAIAAAVMLAAPGAQSPPNAPAAPLAQPAPAAPVAPIAEAPATPPPAATAPALVQDTPTHTLIKLLTSMNSNDRAAMDDCLYTAPAPGRPLLGKASVEEQAAVSHAVRVWKKKFGVDMDVPGYNFGAIPEGTLNVMNGLLATLPAADTKIDGDLAWFSVPMPPELFTGTGANRYAPAERWAGATFTFRRIDGKWQLDMDRSFDLLVYIGDNPTGSDPMDLQERLNSILRDRFNELSDKLEDGSITNSAQGVRFVHDFADRAFRTLQVSGMNANFLPVIGGPDPASTKGSVASNMLSAFFNLAAPAPSAAPAASPDGQDSPINTIGKLCTAIEQDDQHSLHECICDDSIDPSYADLGRAWMDDEAANVRVKRVWLDKFGASMSVPNLGFDSFRGGSFNSLLRGVLSDPQGPRITIDGDEAKVRIPLPPDAFTGVSADRFAANERWSGAMLVLKQSGGVWRLDTDRTFNFVIGLGRKPGNNDDAIAGEAIICHGVADTLNSTAAKIEDGSFTTPKQAASAVTKGMVAAFDAAKVTGSNINALPVIGGTP